MPGQEKKLSDVYLGVKFVVKIGKMNG